MSIQEIVKKLNAKQMGPIDATMLAQKAGYSLFKRGQNKITGLGGKWVYAKAGA